MNNFISIFGLALFIALVLAMLSPKANADDYHDRFWSEYDGSMSRAEYARHRAVEMADEGDHTIPNNFAARFIAGMASKTRPPKYQPQQPMQLPDESIYIPPQPKRSMSCYPGMGKSFVCYEH